MKKYLFAATMLAAAVSSPAFADGNNRSTDTETFTLRANNPAKCNLSASDYTLSIGGNQISDNNGFARTTVSSDVAAAMNGAGVNAWCTGASNTLQMYRTAFVTDTGNQEADAFNRAVIYDVEMSIAGAARSDGYTPIEGTRDGEDNGPGIGVGAGLTVGRFGPTAANAAVTFTADGTSNAVSNGALGGTQARSVFTSDSNRLIAGQYLSSLTIELTPGV
jgi:hypothetical protein